MKKDLPDDLIRSYLNGQLSTPEREQLEERLRHDPAFAAAIAVQRAEMAVAELLIAAETRQLYQQWQANRPPKPWFQGFQPLTWMIGSAVGLLLLLAGWLLLRQPAGTLTPAEQPPSLPPIESPAPNPDLVRRSPETTAPETMPTPSGKRAKNYWALAKQQMQDPLAVNLRRPSADSVLSAFQRAQKAYLAGDYQRTLDLLAQTDPTQQQSATYLSAHALFQLHRFDAAAARFNQLTAQNSWQFRFPSEWGLLMCRLADRPRHEKEFRQQWQAILAQPDHPYFEQAKALREKLHE